MIAAFHSQHSWLAKAVFSALLLAAFAFLTSVIIGGAAPGLLAVATAAGATGLLMILSRWLHQPTHKQRTVAFQL